MKCMGGNKLFCSILVTTDGYTLETIPYNYLFLHHFAIMFLNFCSLQIYD